MKQYFCAGTYTEPILFGTGEVFRGKGKGIAFCEFAQGRFRILKELPLRNPSYLCINEKQRKIYTVNEMKKYMGAPGGGVTQAVYDDRGNLTQEATFNTIGTDPCHIIISPDEKFLSISNFASGSISVFQLDGSGNMNGECQVFQHSGSSIHEKRQTGPHAHSAIFSPDGMYMLVPDLGIDQVVLYSCQNGRVEPAGAISVPAGSGPRFGEFSKDGKHFYLINEISSQILHMRYETGNFTLQGAVNTLPDDFRGENICSDLHISPGGGFLYASNRGHDSIVCYQIKADGSLAFLQRQLGRGKTPRNFAIDPRGEYVLVGNQDSDTISIFKIEKDGLLTYKGKQEFGSPACIRFFRTMPFSKYKSL